MFLELKIAHGRKTKKPIQKERWRGLAPKHLRSLLIRRFLILTLREGIQLKVYAEEVSHVADEDAVEIRVGLHAVHELNAIQKILKVKAKYLYKQRESHRLPFNHQ